MALNAIAFCLCIANNSTTVRMKKKPALMRATIDDGQRELVCVFVRMLFLVKSGLVLLCCKLCIPYFMQKYRIHVAIFFALLPTAKPIKISTTKTNIALLPGGMSCAIIQPHTFNILAQI